MLSIILATRRRPGFLHRTVTQTLKNIQDDKTRIVIAADSDDHGTLSLRDTLTDPRIIWSVEDKPLSLGEKYNRVMRVAPADVYMVMVDYAPCVTPGFDKKIIEASKVYPDGYCVILNHLANLSFSQLNAVTHKLAEKMGGIYPIHFPYWFVDHWLEDVAKQISRQVYVDVWMDTSRRPGTMGKREPFFWGCVFDWCCVERREQARSIINAPDFDETPARKAALLRNEQLVREWSHIINSGLQHEQGEEIDPEDLDYAELKRRGMELIQKYKPVLEQEMKAA